MRKLQRNGVIQIHLNWLGAILGGAIGKELGGGSDGGALLGAILGASVGSDIENQQADGSAGTETVCRTVYREVQVQKIDGYVVAYEYNGRRLISKVNSQPGQYISVWVNVMPNE